MYSRFGRKWNLAARIFIVLLLCTMVTGCWDSSEIDELAIVLESGLDVANASAGSDSQVNEGPILGSVQVAVPRQLGATQSGGAAPSIVEPFQVESAMGRDPAETLENVRKKIARKLIMNHRQVVVVGENYAKLGVKTLLDEILRNPGSRLRTGFVVGYHTDALSILSLPRVLTRVPSEAVEGLEEQYGFENYSVKDFMEGLTGKGDPFALGIESVATQSKETLKTFQIHNVAVFQKDKQVGWLEDSLVPGFLWMSGRVKSGMTSINLPNHQGTVSVKLLRSHVSREVRVDNGKPHVFIKTQIEDDVVENGSTLDLHSPRGVAIVEAAVEKRTESDMKRTLDVLQHQYHSDILQFGDLIYKKSPRTWRKVRNNWRDEYTNLPVQFKTQVQIRRGGLTSPNLNISGQGLK